VRSPDGQKGGLLREIGMKAGELLDLADGSAYCKWFTRVCFDVKRTADRGFDFGFRLVGLEQIDGLASGYRRAIFYQPLQDRALCHGDGQSGDK